MKVGVRARRSARSAGFTLIEVVMVLAILGILGAIVIGRFYDFSDQAKEAACRRLIGDIRVAIRNFGMSRAAQGQSYVLPTTLELRGYADAGPVAPSQVLQGQFPDNPYFQAPPAEKWRANLIRTTTDARGTIAQSDQYAWCYNETTGEFWPNTNVAGENAW